MHRRADGLHHGARDQVAGHRRQWGDAEEQDEHRRHQGSAAHAGQPDDDAHDQGAERERPVDERPFAC